MQSVRLATPVKYIETTCTRNTKNEEKNAMILKHLDYTLIECTITVSYKM